MLARSSRLLAAVLAAAGLVLGLVACSSTATAPVSTVTAPGSGAGLAPTAATSDLPTMTVGELPTEGRDVLGLIADGGPFEYSQDDRTFQNRERILPPQGYGFYREYTVETPGSPDRGARRIIAGDNGAIFYTDDHYNSFREVIE